VPVFVAVSVDIAYISTDHKETYYVRNQATWAIDQILLQPSEQISQPSSSSTVSSQLQSTPSQHTQSSLQSSQLPQSPLKSSRQSSSSQTRQTQKPKQQKRTKTQTVKTASLDTFFNVSPAKKLKTDPTQTKLTKIDDPSFNISHYPPSQVLPSTIIYNPHNQNDLKFRNGDVNTNSDHNNTNTNNINNNIGNSISSSINNINNNSINNNNNTIYAPNNSTNSSFINNDTNGSISKPSFNSHSNGISNSFGNNSNINTTTSSLLNKPLSASSFSKHPSISLANTTPTLSRRSDFATSTSTSTQRNTPLRTSDSMGRSFSQLSASSFSKRDFGSQNLGVTPVVVKKAWKKAPPIEPKSSVVSLFSFLFFPPFSFFFFSLCFYMQFLNSFIVKTFTPIRNCPLNKKQS
jgi:hypothetical protein